jgi:hypothetical protein
VGHAVDRQRGHNLVLSSTRVSMRLWRSGSDMGLYSLQPCICVPLHLRACGACRACWHCIRL